MPKHWMARLVPKADTPTTPIDVNAGIKTIPPPAPVELATIAPAKPKKKNCPYSEISCIGFSTNRDRIKKGIDNTAAVSSTICCQENTGVNGFVIAALFKIHNSFIKIDNFYINVMGS